MYTRRPQMDPPANSHADLGVHQWGSSVHHLFQIMLMYIIYYPLIFMTSEVPPANMTASIQKQTPHLINIPLPHVGVKCKTNAVCRTDGSSFNVILRAVIFIHSSFIHSWKDPLLAPLKGTHGGPQGWSFQNCIKLACIKITALRYLYRCRPPGPLSSCSCIIHRGFNARPPFAWT